MCKFLLLLRSVVSVIRWSLTGEYTLIIHVSNNCFSKNPPEKQESSSASVHQWIFQVLQTRLILEGKLYSNNNQFLFTLYNGHGRVCFWGPSVLLLHSKIGSVMRFEHKCSSWAVPVCLCLCLKYPQKFCTGFDATPWTNHGPFSSVNNYSSPANTEKAGMSLKKIGYIFPSILGNTDQLNISKKQLKQVPCPSVSCLEVK